MDFFVNDVSLHGQFAHAHAFREAFDHVQSCKKILLQYQRRLFVSRQIIDRQVCVGQTFRQAVQATGDRNFIQLVMIWIAKNGPFIEDEQIGDPDEYLSLPHGEVVTDTALGAAAFHQFQGYDAGLVSFAPSNFTYTPVEVHWHRSDSNIEIGEVLNFWEVQALKTHLDRQQAMPQTWREMTHQLPKRFPNLIFLDGFDRYLDGEPFNPYVVERIFVLLDVLNRLKECFDIHGQRTPEGEELMNNYFYRTNARFSDSSESEKNDPRWRAAMTFRTPEGNAIQCFWHGKIKSSQYRIHFTYPIVSDQPLYIVYIGPKLTRK